MKKTILIILLCGIMIIGMTGCGNNTNDNSLNNTNSETSNNNSQTPNKNENNKSSEFEKAIENYKNAKSISIEMEYESIDRDSDYVLQGKKEILIDYKNHLIDLHTTYLYISSFPNTNHEKDDHIYYDIKNNKVYDYDNQCKTWYYYNSSYKEDNRYLEYLDELLYLNEDDAKKVSTNYHFAGKDLMIENDNITWFRLEDIGTQRMAETAEYTFKSFNDTTVSLPSEVKNAIPEKDLCDY